MKRSLLLLFLVAPVLAHANAIEQAPAPRVEKRTAPKRWSDLSKADDASFRRHVIPLMSRSGCSGRECHGAFAGQGGFQLSLFGYDFGKDHGEIIADKEDGPRIDAVNSVKSLILTKPTLDDGETHKGKKRWEKNSWEYNLVRKWIESGAKIDVTETGEFDKLVVEPKELVFKSVGAKIPLKVTAHWKDGTVEDVTHLTRFRTNDESVAEVDADGVVTSKTSGDTHIVAFYDNGVEPVPAMLPVSREPFPKVATRTRVDELVLAKLKKVGIHPSEVCDDDDFLRRTSLDVTGTLPLPAEIEAFLEDRSPDKRAKKIEELLSRPAYAAWWTTKLCDFTGNNPRQVRNVINGARNVSTDISRQWYEWIYKRVLDNEPYDKLAAGIVLATTRTTPTQSYEEMVRELGGYFRKENRADFAARPNLPWFWARNNTQKAEEKALAFAHTFLGVRIECAQCHKHPFDQWTQTDFEQFQAFFAPLTFAERREKTENPNEMTAASLKQQIAAVTKGAADSMMEMKAEPKAAANEPEPLGPPAPKKEKTPEEKRREAQQLAKMQQDLQRRQQDEIARRMETGEPLPWSELYVDFKRAAQRNRDAKTKDLGGSRVITPKLLGGEQVMLNQYPDPRLPLMDWLKGRENPYFAKAFVNRVWAGYFSRGIVEPADDLNLANAPSNEPLLNYLTEGFVAKGYDMRWLHREILNSDTYQRSWKTNATNKHDDKNFSHASIRRLPAEVVMDAITMATANNVDAAKLATSIGERSIGLTGIIATQGGGGKQVEGYALSIFGKPARETNCDCERVTDPTLLQTIYTRNDQSVLRRIDDAGNWIGQLKKAAGIDNPKLDLDGMREKIGRREKELAALKIPAKPGDESPEAIAAWEKKVKSIESMRTETAARIAEGKARLTEVVTPKTDFNAEPFIREVFLRTVSRPPTADEFAKAKEDVNAAKSPVEGIRELLWAMLNTREFMVNR